MTTASVTRLCPNCEDYRRCHSEVRTEEYDVRGEKIPIELPLDVCESCGETLVAESYPHDPIEQVYEKYRRRKGLLTPRKIKQIRERYALSQKSFASLLGMSEATINRYEGGGLQDVVHDNLLREYTVPGNMASLLERQGHLLDASLLSRAEQAVSKVLANKDAFGRFIKRLGDKGLNRAFLRERIFGDMWEDLAAGAANALDAATSKFASLLGLDERALTGRSLKLVAVAPAGTWKLKTRKNTAKKDLFLAQLLARRAGAIAAQGMRAAPGEFSKDGSQIRTEILQAGSTWVDLDNLADYCWCHGIPVLHVWKYPQGTRKPDGLAGRIGDRPIIVISRNEKHSAWLLFILAHELGHIVCGHIQSDAVLLDERIDTETNENGDSEESEANRFAVELLTGFPKTRYRPTSKWPNAQQLAAAARDRAEKDHVDPGHIALNYASGQKSFAVGVAALNELAADEDAPRLISSKMIDYLDWDAIPDELGLFLRRLTNAD